MKLLNVSILTISSILAVSSGYAAKEVSNKDVGTDVSNLKSTGYIDIERIKRENPVPDVDIAKQQKESSSIVDRIKVSDKQKLPESVAKRIELGKIEVPPQKTPDYINDKNLNNQLGAIDLERIAKKYNDALLSSKDSQKGEKGSSDFTAGRAYLFISSSMPKETIQALLNDAGKLGISVFLNGNIGPDPLKFAGTQAFMNTMKIDTPPELFIHPDAFKMFKIDRVPALVVAASDVQDNLDEQGCAAPADFDIMRGDLSLASNMRKIFENASSPDIKDIARGYMKNISASMK
ncbi:type-F conjugative transfer system pilin assembly protein TrbC [Acinetobacter ursingii]|uniref:type-F conjugative transfer system pilin assembly protein TrbC n=1 Tax=Acinetobacter ursingii TaxID=108980 RepID=UPI00254DE0C7|nr:type-F conjugative transfer system pilin assembly protein TrbC [Acinetobacter ursingii]MEC6128134.1 type-F conjugative transfer system pilin assembly protein TrbC [Acinetobacter ursingii]